MIIKEIDEIIMQASYISEYPSEDENLKDDLGIDSLRIVELLFELEDHFNFTISESLLDFNKIVKVGDIHDLVKDCKGGNDNDQ